MSTAAWKGLSQYLGMDYLEYDEDLKRSYEKAGKKALVELAVAMGFQQSRVWYSKGGIAVSGDLHLMGMWSEDSGVHIFFSMGRYDSIVFRKIKHLQDYTGGMNHHISQVAAHDRDTLIAVVMALKA